MNFRMCKQLLNELSSLEDRLSGLEELILENNLDLDIDQIQSLILEAYLKKNL